MHERQLHELNVFVTLTFRDHPGDLCYEYFQKFMKRLRRRFACFDVTLGHWVPRFFACGEYGESFGRPHFHAVLFGVGFPDRVYWRKSDSGHAVDRSQLLEQLWTHGDCYVGDVTFESAAYVARYVMKKVNGQLADHHYGGLTPEMAHMSLRPGIGAMWFERFWRDVYPHGRVVANGIEVLPPKFYDKLFRRVSADAFDRLKAKRALDARRRGDNGPRRRAVKAQVLAAKLRLLRRS